MKSPLSALDFLNGPYSVVTNKTCPYCGLDGASYIYDSFGVLVDIVCIDCGYEKDMLEEVTVN
jgi:hypothetical protein